MEYSIDKAFIEQLRPALRIGFEKRRRRNVAMEDRPRPVMAAMEITVSRMDRTELDHLPVFELYR